MTNNTFKKHKVGNFTVIDNNIFKNKKMSLKSKGLLALMLSLPDEWEYSERGLTVLSTDGRDSIRSGLRELEELGYLIRKQIRNEVGQLVGNQYNVYEEPKLVQPLLEKPISVNTPNKELSNKVLTDKELTNTKDTVDFDYKSVIDYLNQESSRSYKLVEPHKKLIRARYNEGYTLDDFKKVIDNKVSEWKDNDKYSQYLQPSTLFGNKFDGYLNQELGNKKEDDSWTDIFKM